MAQTKPNGETGQAGETSPVPDSVAIVAMGLSNVDYLLTAAQNGNRKFFDEVWGINVMTDIIQCDRGFFMDSISFLKNDPRTEKHLYGCYKDWLSRCNVPVYSSVTDPEFPCIVEYPLEDVVNTLQSSYFSNTVAYAVALAVHIGVKNLFLFGCDYNYSGANKSFEDGRGCVEFYLRAAQERGISVHIAANSSLLDTNKKLRDKMYGYPFEVEVIPDEENSGRVKVVKHLDKPIEWKP
jgi:hypothetical protein